MNQHRHQFRILIQKESYKFSATHFTVFGPGHAERLHGHNYAVAVECGVNALDEMGMAFEFNSLKPRIKQIADLWDEYVLIPTSNPHIQIHAESIQGVPHTIVDFSHKSYRFPDSDVVQLQVRNITSEELAKEFLEKLVSAWMDSMPADERSSLQSRLCWIEVSVEETRGQKAACRRDFNLNSGKST